MANDLLLPPPFWPSKWAFKKICVFFFFLKRGAFILYEQHALARVLSGGGRDCPCFCSVIRCACQHAKNWRWRGEHPECDRACCSSSVTKKRPTSSTHHRPNTTSPRDLRSRTNLLCCPELRATHESRYRHSELEAHSRGGVSASIRSPPPSKSGGPRALTISSTSRISVGTPGLSGRGPTSLDHDKCHSSTVTEQLLEGCFRVIRVLPQNERVSEPHDEQTPMHFPRSTDGGCNACLAADGHPAANSTRA